jgi:hypothetical protein
MSDSAACAVPNGFVITGGTTNSSKCSNMVHFFHATSQTWKTLAPMKHARYYHAAVFFQDALYVIGGVNYQRELRPEMERYDGELNEWVKAGSLNELLPYAVVASKRLFVLSGTLSCAVHEWCSGEWEPRAKMPHECSKGSVTSLNGRIYVLGGIGKDNMCYDVDADQWSLIPPPHFPHTYGGAVKWRGKIVLVGGSDTDVIEEYDVVNNVWTELALHTPVKDIIVGVFPLRP